MADDVFADHVVTDDVTDPSGTVTNLFDYWWDEEDAADAEFVDDYYKNSGVNSDDGTRRQLMFRRQQHGEQPFNQYTGDVKNLAKGVAGPLQGMVSSTLKDGYPELAASVDSELGTGSKLGIAKNESLSYLFDKTEVNGKRAYHDTSGLFRLTDGYYGYDSQKNFVSFDRKTKKFRLYDAPGVATGYDTPDGEFFPFNAPGDVFKTTTDAKGQTVPATDSAGHLVLDDTIKSTNPRMNHYLGLSMSTRFVQKNGGRTIDGTNTPVTYEFSGDDDVWVYIDGVLVGDLGGIHDRSSLKIDFSTGKVTVSHTPDGGKATVVQETDIHKMFEAAGKDDTVTWSGESGDASATALSTASAAADDAPTCRPASGSGNGKTFADDTYHTLQLFYLERGGLDSNLSLRFNLVTMPESDIVKVDQDGKGIAGVGFELYATDKDPNELVAKGTTDANGNLDLMHPQTCQVVFMDTIAKEHGEHFILRETQVPDGYRKVGDLKLKYETNASNGPGTDLDTGVLVVDPRASDAGSPVWDTGALAMAKVQVRAPDESALLHAVTKKNAGITADMMQDGTLFAVIFQRTGTDDQTDKPQWKAVYGDQITGWKHTEKVETTGEESRAAVVEAFRASPRVFALASSGSYETLLEDLPGDIRDYHYWNSDADAQYSVGYYFSTGKYDPTKPASEDNSKDNITAANTIRLDDAKFTRMFAVKLYVPNILNTVSVQKVDQNGNPLTDAEFKLYRDTGASEDKACNASDAGTVQSTCQELDALTTADHHTAKGVTAAGATIPKLGGVGTFPNDKDVRLTNGTYYIVETKVPSDKYKLNTVPVKVIVNDYGVFVDAGTANDDIKVARGAGNLVKTMASYGATGSVDGTLTWLKMTPTLYSSVDGFPTADKTMDVAQNGVQSAKVDSDGKIVPETTMAEPIQLTYGSSAATVLEYEPRNSDGPLVYVSDVGYLMPTTTQDDAPKGEEGVGRVDLSSKARLSSLITGSAIVQVTNRSTEDPPTPGTPSVDVTIPGVKRLEGRDLKAGEFRFAIAAAKPAGAPMPSQTTVTNGADGKFSFGPIRFTKAGTYEYTITEVQGSLEGVTYDGATYTVKVTVTGPDGGNKLSASYEVLGADDQAVGGLTFTNTYEPPNPPEPPDPTDPPEPTDPPDPTDPPEPEEPDNPDPEEPDQPGTPDEPDTPEEPDQPATPDHPSESGDNATPPRLVQTGASVATIVAASMALAVAGLTVLAARLRHRRRTSAHDA
ncbi:Spy0128 family protein [Bifidobacterium moraviense]|uniref:Spy0128 family protein n=1 Tax=Bifidobacterium moraviense TaxID=2675323 RepID=UPI00145C69CF